MAQVFLRRDVIDKGERPQVGPAHGAEGHECTCHGAPGHDCQYEVKYEKVVGELDELRAEYTPIVLNRGKKDEAGKSREVTVLMKRPDVSFNTPMIRSKDMTIDENIARGILVTRGDRLAHFMTGEFTDEQERDFSAKMLGGTN